MTEEKLMTVAEVAERIRVHPESVRRWIRDGEMKAIRLGARAGYRVPASEVERFLKEAQKAS